MPDLTTTTAVDTFMQSADRPGLWAALGTISNPQNVISAFVIDTTKQLNYKSISTEQTFTFSGAPSGGTWFGIQIHNTDTDFAHLATFPSCFSIALNKNVTTATVPSSGDIFLRFYFDGTNYFVLGDFNNTVQYFTVVVGQDACAILAADNSVYVGFQAGKSLTNALSQMGQNVMIGYQAGEVNAGYAQTCIGYFAGKGSQGASNCYIGYSSGANNTNGGACNFIGVHAGENATNAASAQFIGYHTGDAATNASNSVFIGDHCGSNCATAANSIFFGPYSGVDRPHTIWIDTESTIQDGSYVPVIYGQTDTFKLTFNAGTLVTGTTKAAASTVAVASAALEVQSTSQGLLFPRMTTTQKNAISTPAEGLVVYDTTLHKLSVRTAAAWETVTSL